jgi:hypothetical protein
MAEIWKPVVGYEDFYEVSNEGRVRTVERAVNSKCGSLRTVRARIRKPVILNKYPAVNLSMRGKTLLRHVHTMVLEAFIGPRPSPQHEGCHGDGVKTNSALANLRWDTKKANKDDAFRHGTVPIGERVWNAKLSLDQVVSLRSDPRGARCVARELGVSKTTVNRARNGKTWALALAEAGVA